MKNELSDVMTEEEAKRFTWKFMGSMILLSNRIRSYDSAIRTVMKSGLSRNFESAKVLLEKIIGKYSPHLGFDTQFRLDKVEDTSGKTKINMGLYIPSNVTHYRGW